MTTEDLFLFLGNRTELSPSFMKEIGAMLKPEFYKPHQILNAAGSHENKICFIHSGLVRAYFYDLSGQEHTDRFWEGGSLLFSVEGYYDAPSDYYIEVMTETHLLTITYAQLIQLILNHKETSALIRIFLLEYKREEFQKRELISLSSENRYVFLRKNNNSLFGKVSVKIIASYLQMSRETLGRYMSRK